MKWLIFIGLKAVEVGLFVIAPYYLAQVYYKYGITERWPKGGENVLTIWADGFFVTLLILIVALLFAALAYGNYSLACYLWELL